MTMSTKDYVLIARVLREEYDATRVAEVQRIAQRRSIIAVADALASDNPRFDWDRFMEAATGDKP